MELTLSVIVPLREGSPYLDECLAHLREQTFRPFDVFLVPDEPLPRSAPDLRVIASGPLLPNHKRRLAALASSADVLAFIDDDAYPDPAWLESALRHFADATIVAVGGPAFTPPGDSPPQRASGAIYAAAIVSSGTRRRYARGAAADVDAIPSCNLLVRRADFLRHVAACADYWPGEDTLLCHALRQEGGRIRYEPSAVVYHHRRPVFVPHLQQVWAYAVFRGFSLRRFPGSWRDGVYAVPAAFVLAHPALAFPHVRRRARYFVRLTVAAYAAAVVWTAVTGGRRARAHPLVVAVGIYLTHLTYGTGLVVGSLIGPRRRG